MSDRSLSRPGISHASYRRLFAALSARIATALALQRSRRDLRKLDAKLLRDVGLSETDAHAEARRRAWDAPAHWRQPH